jgi:TonB family protein
MMRSFGILVVAMAFLLSAHGSLFAQAIKPDFVCTVASEPLLITPLNKLIHYPEQARKNGLEGQVAVRALIDKQGSIDSVILIKSSDSIFNTEAIRVMKSARYTPAVQDGTPIKVWRDELIKFRLKE